MRAHTYTLAPAICSMSTGYTSEKTWTSLVAAWPEVAFCGMLSKYLKAPRRLDSEVFLTYDPHDGKECWRRLKTQAGEPPLSIIPLSWRNLRHFRNLGRPSTMSSCSVLHVCPSVKCPILCEIRQLVWSFRSSCATSDYFRPRELNCRPVILTSPAVGISRWWDLPLFASPASHFSYVFLRHLFATTICVWFLITLSAA